MRVNGFEEKTFLDRDLLNLELNGEVYPLDALCRMEMYKESDDNIVNIPWVVELTFDFEEGETILAFAFDRERHRLQFALTLRVLRTRNPSLNLAGETLGIAGSWEFSGPIFGLERITPRRVVPSRSP